MNVPKIDPHWTKARKKLTERIHASIDNSVKQTNSLRLNELCSTEPSTGWLAFFVICLLCVFWPLPYAHLE